MSQPQARLLHAVERDHRQLEVNPLQKALDDYHIMEHDRDMAVAQANELRVSNNALLAEINMLREAYERADTDRIRLQTISSTLLGRLLAINDCIAGAVKSSIKDGIEAVQASKAEDELERDAEALQDVFQRVQPQEAPETAATPEATQRAPQAAGGLPPGPFLR